MNEELIGELNSIRCACPVPFSTLSNQRSASRAELTNSMQDILMTRHIVAAVEVGSHDITPWRGPRSESGNLERRASHTGTEDVDWQQEDGG